MRILMSAAIGALIALSSGGEIIAQQTAKPAKPVVETKRAAKSVRLAVHVSDGDPKLLSLALNNVQNTLDYYAASGRPIKIEVVAYGPGLTLLRSDKSPVKDRIASMALAHPTLTFSACENTIANLKKLEGADIPLVAEARRTPSGVVRLIELQDEGYAYLKP